MCVLAIGDSEHDVGETRMRCEVADGKAREKRQRVNKSST